MMDLEQLKSDWKSIGASKKNQDELLIITQINKQSIKRIKIQFLMEGIALLAFTFLYYDAFDGTDKPLLLNILLISSAIGVILSRFLGWQVMQNPMNGQNIKKSLKIFQRKLQRIMIWVLLSSFIFGLSFISFFTFSSSLDNKKIWILSMLLLTFFALMGLAYKIWTKRIKQLNEVLTVFNESV